MYRQYGEFGIADLKLIVQLSALYTQKTFIKKKRVPWNGFTIFLKHTLPQGKKKCRNSNSSSLSFFPLRIPPRNCPNIEECKQSKIIGVPTRPARFGDALSSIYVDWPRLVIKCFTNVTPNPNDGGRFANGRLKCWFS